MNELQAEKIRDIIALITKESGQEPQTTINDFETSIKINFSFIIPREGNTK